MYNSTFCFIQYKSQCRVYMVLSFIMTYKDTLHAKFGGYIELSLIMTEVANYYIILGVYCELILKMIEMGNLDAIRSYLMYFFLIILEASIFYKIG